ncbi:hypothetical protein VOLCADRAFT_88263 [Volvox carteri f. nagariensis]|uniref:Uncharacterized protein n=1 Tax=Volvox carteri f. nagariensis TaxID=3068 RepID=D8TNQ5_VOLCA|nr:uncharacterized protein VOLCADRAFT_88263 [Volvox carteri f. nagariensis]EFJ50880.1 hypothetical protein VOLCADRAFT_88263 [Volvox carteri f. nagariensis]|eukprot:XP_002947892.1 hypothetical protein VOLCADRAFT_88263 [Volvox carteri f. nagariensis]
MAASEYPSSTAAHAGSAAASASPKITKLPEDVQPEVRQLISTVQAFKAATDWDRIDSATRALDADCVYDSPFMYITGGRDRVRAVAKLLAPFAYTEFDPKLVHITMNSAERKAELEVEGMLRVLPRRYWFAPVTWILPSSIPLGGTITLHVTSWNDKVSRIQERFTNIPVIIPRLVRWLAGWAMGSFGVVAEPALCTLNDWYTAGFTSVQGSMEQVVQQHPQAAAVISKAAEVRDKVATSAEAAKARVMSIVSE